MRRSSRRCCARALDEAVATTFNAITVDGECSTNDTVVALASGASGVTIDERATIRRSSHGLRRSCRTLALGDRPRRRGRDQARGDHGHGRGFSGDARRAAKTIANSPLVKTAVHGGDPNWGRLVAAAGRSGAPFAIDRARGAQSAESCCSRTDSRTTKRRREAAEYLRGTDIDIEVDLGTGGTGEATVWTCDLSAEYVRINGEYRT